MGFWRSVLARLILTSPGYQAGCEWVRRVWMTGKNTRRVSVAAAPATWDSPDFVKIAILFLPDRLHFGDNWLNDISGRIQRACIEFNPEIFRR